MKLLLTMNLPYTRVHGGTNRSNRALCEGLVARGHSVRAVVPALATPSQITYAQFLEQLAAEGVDVRSHPDAAILTLAGVEVHAVGTPARLRRYLLEQIQAFAPDWVLVSAEDPSQSLLEAALQLRPAQVIYLAHTPQMFPFGPASLYPGHERTELVRRAAGVAVISQFVADYVKTWAGITALVNQPPHYGPGPFPRLGRPDSGAMLLMNASMIKGLPLFLSLARARPELPFAALPGYATTTADREALGALPNVTLLANRADLDDIFRETRVLLMPSLWIEGFGVAVVDAMTRGIPVLASNFGGLTEAKLGTDLLLPVHPITQFEPRLDENFLPIPIVPEQDLGPWLAALSRLVDDQAFYEQQSAAAYDAAARFTAQLSIAPFEEFLLRLAAVPPDERVPSMPAPIRSDTAQKAARVTEKIANLSPEQRALLIRRLQQRSARGEQPPAALPRWEHAEPSPDATPNGEEGKP